MLRIGIFNPLLSLSSVTLTQKPTSSFLSQGVCSVYLPGDEERDSRRSTEEVRDIIHTETELFIIIYKART